VAILPPTLVSGIIEPLHTASSPGIKSDLDIDLKKGV
jgi:hypothetical protein